MLDIWLGWTFGWVGDLVDWVGPEFCVDLDRLGLRFGWDYIFGWVGELVGWEICLCWTFGWVSFCWIGGLVGLDWVRMQFWLAGVFIWLDLRLCFVGYFSGLDIGWVGEWVGLDRVGLELWLDLAGLGW